MGRQGTVQSPAIFKDARRDGHCKHGAHCHGGAHGAPCLQRLSLLTCAPLCSCGAASSSEASGGLAGHMPPCSQRVHVDQRLFQAQMMPLWLRLVSQACWRCDACQRHRFCCNSGPAAPCTAAAPPMPSQPTDALHAPPLNMPASGSGQDACAAWSSPHSPNTHGTPPCSAACHSTQAADTAAARRCYSTQNDVSCKPTATCLPAD